MSKSSGKILAYEVGGMLALFLVMACSQTQKIARTPEPQCTTSSNPKLAIIGGEILSDHQAYAWTINIGGGVCGGTLIDPSWVVTAAHCYHWATPAAYIKWGSDQNLLNPKMLRVSVKRVILHPEYKNDASDYGIEPKDIALLELESPVNGIKIMPNLAAKSAQSGEKLRVLGWGNTVRTGDAVSSNVLKTAVLKVTDDPNLPQNKFVLRSESGSDGIGGGDSGGPAVRENSDGSFELVGITSTGNGFTSSHTDVSAYLDWITGYLPKKEVKVLAPQPTISSVDEGEPLQSESKCPG